MTPEPDSNLPNHLRKTNYVEQVVDFLLKGCGFGNSVGILKNSIVLSNSLSKSFAQRLLIVRDETVPLSQSAVIENPEAINDHSAKIIIHVNPQVVTKLSSKQIMLAEKQANSMPICHEQFVDYISKNIVFDLSHRRPVYDLSKGTFLIHYHGQSKSDFTLTATSKMFMDKLYSELGVYVGLESRPREECFGVINKYRLMISHLTSNPDQLSQDELTRTYKLNRQAFEDIAGAENVLEFERLIGVTGSDFAESSLNWDSIGAIICYSSEYKIPRCQRGVIDEKNQLSALFSLFGIDSFITKINTDSQLSYLNNSEVDLCKVSTRIRLLYFRSGAEQGSIQVRAGNFEETSYDLPRGIRNIHIIFPEQTLKKLLESRKISEIFDEMNQIKNGLLGIIRLNKH
jgi:hypothetical protein